MISKKNIKKIYAILFPYLQNKKNCQFTNNDIFTILDFYPELTSQKNWTKYALEFVDSEHFKVSGINEKIKEVIDNLFLNINSSDIEKMINDFDSLKRSIKKDIEIISDKDTSPSSLSDFKRDLELLSKTETLSPNDIPNFFIASRQNPSIKNLFIPIQYLTPLATAKAPFHDGLKKHIQDRANLLYKITEEKNFLIAKYNEFIHEKALKQLRKKYPYDLLLQAEYGNLNPRPYISWSFYSGFPNKENIKIKVAHTEPYKPGELILKRLKDRMLSKDINTTTLAEYSGISRTTINKLLKGKNNFIYSDNLDSIAKVLACTSDYLCGKTNCLDILIDKFGNELSIPFYRCVSDKFIADQILIKDDRLSAIFNALTSKDYDLSDDIIEKLNAIIHFFVVFVTNKNVEIITKSELKNTSESAENTRREINKKFKETNQDFEDAIDKFYKQIKLIKQESDDLNRQKK